MFLIKLVQLKIRLKSLGPNWLHSTTKSQGTSMPTRHFGYACVNETLKEQGVIVGSTLRFNSFSIEKVNDVILKNIIALDKVTQWNISNGIKYYRVHSDLFPFFDHEKDLYKLNDLPQGKSFVSYLAKIGQENKANGIRLSCHPGPFTILASPNDSVNAKTIKSLDMHYLIGQLLEQEDWNINFHIGGTYGNKQETADRFCRNYDKLNDNIKKNITIENDDKESQWTMVDLYELIYKKVGVRLCFDYHHHLLNSGGVSYQEASALAFSTWPDDQIPETHYSESAEGKNPVAHSDYVSKEIPDFKPDVLYDVMLECKAKELALLQYRKGYVLH